MLDSTTVPKTYLIVFAALIALTALTVGVAGINMGNWHGPVGLGIASLKGALVVLFFMHVWRSSKLTWVVALSGVFWLTILLGLTLADILTRSWPL